MSLTYFTKSGKVFTRMRAGWGKPHTGHCHAKPGSGGRRNCHAGCEPSPRARKASGIGWCIVSAGAGGAPPILRLLSRRNADAAERRLVQCCNNCYNTLL